MGEGGFAGPGVVGLGVVLAAWLAVFLAASRLSGWRALAAVYPSSGAALGERYRMRSARVGRCPYNGAITFGAGPAGLSMSMPWPFRFEHPPVFLPWSELTVASGRIGPFEVVRFVPEQRPGSAIAVPRRLGEKLVAASAGAARASAGGPATLSQTDPPP